MNVRINSIKLGFSDQGQGAPLVFIHAFPLNRHMWDPQVKALSSTSRTIAVDLRGHGESDAPIWRNSVEQFADDVIGLLDHLNIIHATFVGLSMGGYILFAMYRKYPERVKRLVLADTRAQADTPEGKDARISMAQIAYHKGAGMIAELMLPKLFSPATFTSKPELVETVRHMINTTPVSGIIGDLIAMADRPDSTDLLPHITCPTLVIVGQDDAATPVADSQLMAERIPHAHLQIIPNAGHLSNMEQPEAFNTALESFLKIGKSHKRT